jgi:hypothetical protein
MPIQELVVQPVPDTAPDREQRVEALLARGLSRLLRENPVIPPTAVDSAPDPSVYASVPIVEGNPW